MKKAYSFWEFFDDPVVQGFAFALWGVPLYVLLKWIPQLINRYYPIHLLAISESDQVIVSGFIEWFGVLYGLILALVLVNVWTQFDTTERAFDREADAVLTLFNTFLFISNSSIKFTVGKRLLEYIDSVRVSLDQGGIGQDVSTEKQEIALKEIRTEISELLHSSENPHLPITLLDLLNKLVDYRGDRISYSKQRLPAPVKYLSIVASVAWLIPFFVLKFDNPLIGPFFVVAVILVVVSILLIIEDLDNPIGGAWGVKLIPWVKIESVIKTEIAVLEKVTP